VVRWGDGRLSVLEGDSKRELADDHDTVIGHVCLRRQQVVIAIGRTCVEALDATSGRSLWQARASR
jgi:hypothetical protein